MAPGATVLTAIPREPSSVARVAGEDLDGALHGGVGRASGQADARQAGARYTAAQAGDSPFATVIDGLTMLRSDHAKPPAHMIFRPAFCIVVQGAKWSTFGGRRLD